MSLPMTVLAFALAFALSAPASALDQAEGQPAFEMGHDDAGDFHPLAFDALLKPQRKCDGRYAATSTRPRRTGILPPP